MSKYPERMREMISETVRNSIHQAGIELIREHGWDAFTTERIADRAGVSRGVLYHYFTNKESIAKSIIDESIRKLNQELRIIAEGPGTARERLLAISKRYVENFVSQRELHRTLMKNLPPPGQEKPPIEMFQERDEILSKLLQEGIEKGEFQIENIPAATVLLYGGLHELCVRMMFDTPNLNADVNYMVKIYLKGILFK